MAERARAVGGSRGRNDRQRYHGVEAKKYYFLGRDFWTVFVTYLVDLAEVYACLALAMTLHRGSLLICVVLM